MPEYPSARGLLPQIYQDLHALALSKLQSEPPGATLSPTVLVHDAWLRLVETGAERQWNGRQHFYRAAAEAMRCILIDKARRRKAIRHGGGWQRTELEGIEIPNERHADELFAVHEALTTLAAHHSRKAELVKLRYFVGLTIEQAAAVLDISKATAERDWLFARAWLHREISKNK